MYTIFLTKSLTTDPETGEQIYICGTEGYDHILRHVNVTRYCSMAEGDLIRYETYNEEIAAKLRLDAGFVADRESDVPEDLLNKSKFYTWGEEDNYSYGDYNAWVEAGSPKPTTIVGPAQIFGPGEARYMSLEEANTIISNL